MGTGSGPTWTPLARRLAMTGLAVVLKDDNTPPMNATPNASKRGEM